MLVLGLLFHLFSTPHSMPPAARHDSIVYYAAVELMNWLCGTSAIQYILLYRNWIDIKSSYLILLEQHLLSDYALHPHCIPYLLLCRALLLQNWFNFSTYLYIRPFHPVNVHLTGLHLHKVYTNGILNRILEYLDIVPESNSVPISHAIFKTTIK